MSSFHTKCTTCTHSSSSSLPAVSSPSTSLKTSYGSGGGRDGWSSVSASPRTNKSSTYSSATISRNKYANNAGTMAIEPVSMQNIHSSQYQRPPSNTLALPSVVSSPQSTVVDESAQKRRSDARTIRRLREELAEVSGHADELERLKALNATLSEALGVQNEAVRQNTIREQKWLLERSAMNDEKRQLMAQLQAAESQLAKCRAECQQQQQAHHKCQNELQLLRQQMAAHKSQHAQLQADHQNCDTLIEQLRAQIDPLKQSVKESEVAARLADEARIKVTTELTQSRAAFAGLQSEHDQCAGIISALRAQLVARDEEIERLTKRLSVADAIVHTHNTECPLALQAVEAEMAEMRESLVARCDQLERDLAAVTASHAGCDAALSQAVAARRAAEDSVTKLQREHDAQRDRADALDAAHRSCGSDADDLRARLAAAEAAAEAAKQDLESKTRECAQLQDAHANCDAIIADLRSQLETATASLAALTEQHNELTTTHNAVVTQHSQCAARLAQARGEAASASSMAAELARLKQEHDQCAARLAQQKSMSDDWERRYNEETVAHQTTTTTLSRTEQELAAARREHEPCAAALQAARDAHSGCAAQIATLTSSLQQSQQETTQARAEVVRVTEQLRVAEKSLAELRDIHAQCGDAAAAAAQSAAEIARLKQLASDLQRQLDAAVSEHAGCEPIITQLREDLAATKAKYEAVASELESLKETHQALMITHEACARTIAELQQRRDELETQLSAAVAAHAGCDAKYSALETVHAACADKVAAVPDEVLHAQCTPTPTHDEAVAALAKERDERAAERDAAIAAHAKCGDGDAAAAAAQQELTVVTKELGVVKEELRVYKDKEAALLNAQEDALKQLKTMKPQVGVVFSSGPKDGVLATSCPEEYPAYKSGLRKDDIIIEVNMRQTHSKAEFKASLNGVFSGDRIPVLFRRNKKYQTTMLEVGSSGFEFPEIKRLRTLAEAFDPNWQSHMAGLDAYDNNMKDD